ncbi:2TM domain-containing protein [Flavobacterium sp.]|uniref:2TM domain-containing protein n=1 Tax=Flavobacterium sp. TaxID=239 RepID=UPI004034678B
MEPNFEEQSYLRAKKRVKEIRSFYDHVASYIIVIPVLALINIYYTGGEHWYKYTAFGWGLGLAIHGIVTFLPSFFGRGWEERKLNEILEKDKQKRK